MLYRCYLRRPPKAIFRAAVMPPFWRHPEPGPENVVSLQFASTAEGYFPSSSGYGRCQPSCRHSGGNRTHENLRSRSLTNDSRLFSEQFIFPRPGVAVWADRDDPETLCGGPGVSSFFGEKNEKGIIGVSSICPETCGRHAGAIVSIQKSLSEDAIRTPSKMDGSVLPGAQEGDSTSFKW